MCVKCDRYMYIYIYIVMPRVIKRSTNIYKITYIEMQILHAHCHPLLLKQLLFSVSLRLPFLFRRLAEPQITCVHGYRILSCL